MDAVGLELKNYGKKQKKSKTTRVLPHGGSRASGCRHSGSGRGGVPTARNPPPARRPRVPDFLDFFELFVVFAFCFSKKSIINYF